MQTGCDRSICDGFNLSIETSSFHPPILSRKDLSPGAIISMDHNMVGAMVNEGHNGGHKNILKHEDLMKREVIDSDVLMWGRDGI